MSANNIQCPSGYIMAYDKESGKYVPFLIRTREDEIIWKNFSSNESELLSLYEQPSHVVTSSNENKIVPTTKIIKEYTIADTISLSHGNYPHYHIRYELLPDNEIDIYIKFFIKYMMPESNIALYSDRQTSTKTLFDYFTLPNAYNNLLGQKNTMISCGGIIASTANATEAEVVNIQKFTSHVHALNYGGRIFLYICNPTYPFAPENNDFAHSGVKNFGKDDYVVVHIHADLHPNT